jgi:hypothetical protein
MSDETKTSGAEKAEGDSCCHTHCQCACKFMAWIGALILVLVGAMALGCSLSWAGYKKVKASEYDITFISEKGEAVNVQQAHYIKLYRNVNRVDILADDKSTKECYYNVKGVSIKKK